MAPGTKPVEPDSTPGVMRTTDTVRIVAMACLTVIIVAAIAGITIAAVMTNRNVWPAEVLTAIAAVWLAIIGGMSIRRRFDIAGNGADNGGRGVDAPYHPPPDVHPRGGARRPW